MVEEYKPEKVGVWIEVGKVYRSDIGEERNPYIPTKGHTLEEVVEILIEIQKLRNLGDKPDHGPKTNLDGLLDYLKEIAVERSRFIVEGKNLLSELLR